MESSQPTLADGVASPELLYDTYYAEAVSLAFRILWDTRDAEDVAQEGFLAAWRAQQSYDRTKGTVKGRVRLGLDRLRTNLRQVTPPYGPSTRKAGGL